jgi:hypothetical protein
VNFSYLTGRSEALSVTRLTRDAIAGMRARQAGESLMLTIFPSLLNFFMPTPFRLPLQFPKSRFTSEDDS